jgi:ribosome recycling factor
LLEVLSGIAGKQLAQEGFQIRDDEEVSEDQEFLMELMEAHESVDDTNADTIANLEQLYKHKEEECLKVHF